MDSPLRLSRGGRRQSSCKMGPSQAALMVKGTTPYHDRKSAQAIERMGDSGILLRKRVRNSMKTQRLEGCGSNARALSVRLQRAASGPHTPGATQMIIKTKRFREKQF